MIPIGIIAVKAFRPPRAVCNNPRMRTAIGDPVERIEDPGLLRGEGRYTDDVSEPNQAYAYVVRSPHAHGLLRGIDSQKARAMPGVLAVYTAQDLAAYGPHKCKIGRAHV